MSGPKGYDYALNEALRRRRELEALGGRWRELLRQARELQAQLRREGLSFDVFASLAEQGYGSARRDHPSDADLDTLDTFQKAVERARQAAGAERTRRIVEQTRAALRERARETEFTVTRLSSSPASRTRATPTPSRDADAERAAREKKIQSLLELLAQTSSEDREQLTSEIVRLSQARTPSDDRAWLTLTRRVTDAVREQRDRAARDEAARDLLTIVARVTGPAADDLTARVHAAGALTAVERLRPDVLAAVAQAELEAERAFVVATALDVWRDLGYEADDDFAAMALTSEGGLLRRDAWPDHALLVRVSPTSTRINTNIVALGETDPLRDTEVEEESCGWIGDFQEGMRARQVEAPLARRHPPGALPVQRRAAPQRDTRTRRTQETQRRDHL
ncbi:MAG: hypothetical protein QM621_01860 [Aeromicrobium sp.]|uniref:hypothetical protein n=1 Tax=Aeromicrobium sp. TaxID=1871063 RepID=UPI0039E61879